MISPAAPEDLIAREADAGLQASAIRRPVTLGVVIGSRAFFSPAPCRQAREEVLAQLERLGIGALILPFEATQNGAVQSLADAQLYADFFRRHRDRIDGLVVCLPNFGDEIAIVELVNRARLNVPILLQASNDENDKVSVRERRDAFCGKISVSNNFWQYGIPFTETTWHTVDAGGPEFAADLDRFARICRTVRGLRGARLGAIGARTGAFQTMRYSEKLLQDAGITVVTVDLSEMMGAAGRVRDDDPALLDKLERIRSYGRIPPHVRPEQVLRQAKWSLAVDRWIRENGCDASAIQCWRSLQDNFGCATCVTMSMMGEALMPSACEVDIMGALSMYALALASGAPPAILDWNNNFGREPDMCVATHCGNFPRSFIGDTPEIGELDVLGETIGREKCFGAVKGKVKAGPMTYFRISSDDRAGTLKAYLGQGEFTDDPYGMDGGIAVVRVPRLRSLMRFVTQNGFEHHVAMVRGHHAAVVGEALTRYLRWPLYDHDTPPEPVLVPMVRRF
ncbi:L-fucose isomerase/related protein [Rubellimicrobium thermophilum DSM 16684]|uniref:L-fucose isomerase/related protein n=1 Tax=Rubellimicrobium thermophilum DSM 16684 TaxID=1123069 RepID=S9SBI8_9RHOB|nr:L-fucose isomerase/related protein [Rubellimicrobium thermophilum]EPX87490.1 L-fucose isomerase/related protein [Rubellimicrobium thermophilum DSM 16684]